MQSRPSCFESDRLRIALTQREPKKSMRFEEACKAINDLSKALPHLFEEVRMSFHFGGDKCPIGDWSDPPRIGMLIAGDGIGCRSGVYLFSSSMGDVIYIGKAAKDNLHNRVWDHVRTPAPLPSGHRAFPSNRFKSKTGCPLLQKEIEEGRIRLGVITVSDPHVVPIIEVYLHTLHVKLHGGRLPELNLQIG
jgi:hypothetical protein